MKSVWWVDSRPRYIEIDGERHIIDFWGGCPFCTGMPYGEEDGEYECSHPNGHDICEAYRREDMAFPDNCPLRRAE